MRVTWVSRPVDARAFGNIKAAAEHEHVRRDAQRIIDNLAGDLRRLARRLAASGGIELPTRSAATEYAIGIGGGELLPVHLGNPATEPAPDTSAIPMPLRGETRMGDPDGLYGLARDWGRCSVTLTVIDQCWHQVEQQLTAVAGPTLPAGIVHRLRKFGPPIEDMALHLTRAWVVADRARRLANGNSAP